MTSDTKDVPALPERRQVRSDAEAQEIVRWLKAQVNHDKIYFDPTIPAKKVLAARQACNVPESERVLALVDFTLFGSAAECLVVGWSGIYCRWPREVPPKKIDFAKLIESEVTLSWSVVSVGSDLKFAAGGEPGEVLKLLKGLQDVLVNGVRAPSDSQAAAATPFRMPDLMFAFVLIGLVLFFARDFLSGEEDPLFLMIALVAAILFATFLFGKIRKPKTTWRLGAVSVDWLAALLVLVPGIAWVIYTEGSLFRPDGGYLLLLLAVVTSLVSIKRH